MDAFPDCRLARGRLHEICAPDADDAISAAAFAAIMALRANGPDAVTIWLRTEAAQRRSGHFYAAGLAELGFDPGLIVVALTPNDIGLLRSAADAARCPGLGTIIIECWGNPPVLDLTASRRLMLAAEGSGVTLLLLRIEAQPGASAAETRWRIAAAPSIELAANAPGHPVFEVELTRRRAGPAGPVRRLEWSRDNKIFRESALSGALVSLPAYRPAVHPNKDRRIA